MWCCQDWGFSENHLFSLVEILEAKITGYLSCRSTYVQEIVYNPSCVFYKQCSSYWKEVKNVLVAAKEKRSQH